jgi:hypothetical protein
MQLIRWIPAVAVLATLTRALSAQDVPEVTVQFDPPIRLKAGDEFIDTGKDIAHAGPLSVDLDANGKPDLLVGNFQGHFQVYMNAGTRAEPVFTDKGLLQADGKTVEVSNW